MERVKVLFYNLDDIFRCAQKQRFVGGKVELELPSNSECVAVSFILALFQTEHVPTENGNCKFENSKYF